MMIERDVETSAESDYVARGILETVQNTIISTRTAISVEQILMKQINQ